MLPIISLLPDSWRTDLQAKLADDETIVATLVLPYLTVPLMDSVLIPYQNDMPIDTALVGLYLGGLLLSALLAWILG